jgi:uncharacterized protein YjiS (DUF1127 family)
MTHRHLPIPTAAPVTGLAAVAFGHFAHLVDSLDERRREWHGQRQFRKRLETYRGMDSRMLDDIGLSMAVIEGARAGEDGAIQAFLAWSRGRRLG